MEYIIYKILCKITNKSYIGFTNNLKRRIKNHKAIANSGKGYYLHEAIRKYGWVNFIVEVLRTSNNEKYALNFIEPTLIKKYNSIYPNGYNVTSGGERGFKGPMSKEHKIKIGLGNKGKIRTYENKEKNRIAHIGKINSKETKKRISIGLKKSKFHRSFLKKLHKQNIGKKRTIEQKQNISNGLKNSVKAQNQLKQVQKANKGRKFSKQHKENIRLARLLWLKNNK